MLVLLLTACLGAIPDYGAPPAPPVPPPGPGGPPVPMGPPPTAAMPMTGKVAAPESQVSEVGDWKGNPSVMVVKAGVAKPEYVATANAAGAKLEILPTQQTFALVWRPPETPKGVIVSLHGSNAYAYGEIALWLPYAKERSLAIVSVQWWDGDGDAIPHYLPPLAVYNAVVDVVHRNFGYTPPPVILHGFSRGSANTYAVAAWDKVATTRLFSGIISNAGGYQSSYPPNQRIEAGAFGARPFVGTKWVVVCGTADPEPEINGCPAMARTKTWLESEGSNVTSIEIPNGFHGAFQNAPTAVKQALDYLL